MNKMKTLSQMEELLQKFYDGATTADEERILQEFLNSADCPEAWAADRAVLSALATPAEVPVPAGLSERIAASIRPRRRFALRRLFPAAAAAAAVVAVGILVLSHPEPAMPTASLDTCATPEEAALEVEHAFSMLSRAMNQSIAMQ